MHGRERTRLLQVPVHKDVDLVCGNHRVGHAPARVTDHKPLERKGTRRRTAARALERAPCRKAPGIVLLQQRHGAGGRGSGVATRQTYLRSLGNKRDRERQRDQETERPRDRETERQRDSLTIDTLLQRELIVVSQLEQSSLTAMPECVALLAETCRPQS